tara:strand:+ start:233 stop:847 length:615 start_codon:yes stop_codon:yes gene_type:complete
MNLDLCVQPATIGDLKYIDHLQRKNAEELAFYPNQVFEREVSNHRVLLAKVNSEPAGYIYHGALGQVCKIHQACIEYDLRGQLYGAALIRNLFSLADASNVLSITLRCGSDIEANMFWKAMGFYCEAVTAGGVRRMRDINCWRYDLQQPLFVINQEPSDKKKDASVWQKRKSSADSSFQRGKKMRQYREKILAEAMADGQEKQR